jgi:conjugative transposon TraN protein
MKYLTAILIFCLSIPMLRAQDTQIKKVYVNKHVSTHFICSEPVQYVDVSTDNVVGDIPLSNIVRVRPRDSTEEKMGILTIVAEQYLIQYMMIYGPPDRADKQILVQQSEGTGLMVPALELTNAEMKSFAVQALQTTAKKPIGRKRAFGMEIILNQIYTVGDYYLLDLSLRNSTNIPYDIDQLRFRVEDKKILKATNVQSVELEPEFQYYEHTHFRNKYRNVFVFRKFTFPGQKVFTIELAEEQISGRNLKLEIAYKDVLDADVL